MDIKERLRWINANSVYGLGLSPEDRDNISKEVEDILKKKRVGDMMIEKCKTCESFNRDTGKMRNKLRCMFMCADSQMEQHRQAMIYNRSVCGEEFDSKPLYEHGKRVYGSGLKGE